MSFKWMNTLSEGSRYEVGLTEDKSIGYEGKISTFNAFRGVYAGCDVRVCANTSVTWHSFIVHPEPGKNLSIDILDTDIRDIRLIQ